MEPVAEVVKHYGKSATTLPFSEPTPLATSFEYDDYNKLTEITFPDSATEALSYDDNRQLVKSEKSTGETTNYVWNDQGMLVKVILPGGEPVEYEYDGNQRLISRKSSDGVDNFVQSGWDIVTKMDDVGKRTYYTGMSALSGAGSASGSSAVESEDSVKYFHYNHRGDTVLVTDANGEILHNLNYEAYGKPTNNEGIPINTLSLKNATDPGNNCYSTTSVGNTSGGSGNNLPNLYVGASGIRYDTKTNLHYMRFRWFSANQMRFISPDLLMDLNRYAYVSGNPVLFIDEFGLQMNEPQVFIEYIKNGKWISIPVGVKPRGIRRFEIRAKLKGMSVEDYYNLEADVSSEGLYDISTWPEFDEINGPKPGDRKVQTCFALATAGPFPVEVTPDILKQILKDNYYAIDPSKVPPRPGDLIAYFDFPNKDKGDRITTRFGHVDIIIDKHRFNDNFIIARNADFPIYYGSSIDSKKRWGTRGLWRMKKDAKFRLRVNSLWFSSVKSYNPFEAMKDYCKIQGKEESLRKWYDKKRK